MDRAILVLFRLLLATVILLAIQGFLNLYNTWRIIQIDKANRDAWNYQITFDANVADILRIQK